MTPRITTCGTFAILGVAWRITRGSESPELFGRIWKNFESRRREIEAAAAQKVYFGVSFPTDEEGVTEYLAGMMVAPGTPPLEGMEARTVSGGEYAVFECPVDAIGATYYHVFNVWLPSAAVQFDSGRAPFEEYPENTTEQPVRLHIPVRQQPTRSEQAG
jgi:predicted transcriptional regulator YdeE